MTTTTRDADIAMSIRLLNEMAKIGVKQTSALREFKKRGIALKRCTKTGEWVRA